MNFFFDSMIMLRFGQAKLAKVKFYGEKTIENLRSLDILITLCDH